MNTLLLLLVILGLGAIIISIYVFAEGARTYDTELGPGRDSSVEFKERNPITRRTYNATGFPLSINGIVIQEDRRSVSDRRQLAA
jgi:hypothetical protein